MSNTTTQNKKEERIGVGEVGCPFCGKAVTNQEYQQATQEFRERTEQAYRDKFDRYKKGFEDQLLEQEKKHRLEIESLRKTRLQG